MIYSPRKLEAYTVVVDGVRDGIGAHPAFKNNLGAWNVFWLSSTVMDAYLTDTRTPGEQLPFSSRILPISVGDSLYHLESGVTVGNLTLVAEPREWLDKVSKDPIFTELISTRLFGDSWVDHVKTRIAEYESRFKSKARVIPVNFGRV